MFKNKNEIFSITQNVKQEAVKDAEWKETEKCKKIYKLYSNFLANLSLTKRDTLILRSNYLIFIKNFKM